MGGAESDGLSTVLGIGHSGSTVVSSAEVTFWTLFLAVFVTMAFFAGLYLIFRGTGTYRTYSLVRNTPTADAGSAALGRVELEGTARPAGSVIDRPFTRGTCLYADWQIEEYTQKLTDKHDSWYLADQGTETTQFVLEDERGSVLVHPPETAIAELDDVRTSSRVVDADETPTESIESFCRSIGLAPVSSDRRRYTQTVLPEDTEIYVFGELANRPSQSDTSSGGDAVLGTDTSSDRFILSDKGGTALRAKYRRRTVKFVGSGLLLAAICLGVWVRIAQFAGLRSTAIASLVGIVILLPMARTRDTIARFRD